MATVLCNDARAAAADWEVNASAWATAAGLAESARKAFWDEQDAWVHSVAHDCVPMIAIAPSRIKCVVVAFQARSRTLEAKLPPDAVAEVQLLPQQRTDIQNRQEGFLMSSASGYRAQATIGGGIGLRSPCQRPGMTRGRNLS